MEIINKTPHPITLCKEDGSVIKVYKPDGEPIRTSDDYYWFKRSAFLKYTQNITFKTKSLSFALTKIHNQIIKLFYKGLPNPKNFIIKYYAKRIKILNEPEPKKGIIYVVSSQIMALSNRKDYASMLIYHGKHDATCPFIGLILQHK